jgi:hypothetical protein
MARHVTSSSHCCCLASMSHHTVTRVHSNALRDALGSVLAGARAC